MANFYAAVAIPLLVCLLSACNRCPDGLERIGDECRDLVGEARKAAAAANAAKAAAEQRAARQAKENAEERRYQEIKRISEQNKRCEKEGCDLVPTTPNPEDWGILRRGQARERLNIRAKIARNSTCELHKGAGCVMEPVTDEEQAMLAAAE